VTAVYQQNGLDHFCLIAQSLENCLHTDARHAGYFVIPDDSYNPLRKQYNPEYIIKELSELPGADDDCRIGIVDVDIYARGLNFIFGLANPLRRIALVSVYRLSGPQINERIAKEVVHEMGHIFGLGHCADPHCVMYFSNTIEDTDKKSENLCGICRSKLEE
jgi:archaemetzincin